MRIIKLVVISLLLLFLVANVISFFLPSRIRISRTIRIDSNKETVMQELSDPARWKDWYPGADSASFYYEAGTLKGLVFKEQPKLSLVIREQRENEVLANYNRSSSSQPILSTWRIYPETGFNHVTVQWYLDFHLRWYPWEKFASLVYDKFYGSMMDHALERLKTAVESR